MRIDGNGIGDIAKLSIGVESKSSKTVDDSASNVGAAKKPEGMVSSYGIQATTVEKALVSLESELDKIKQEAGQMDLDTIMHQMAVLSNALSGEDYQKLQEEGYSLNDTDVATIVTVMDKIKAELAKSGMDIRVFGDDLSMEQMEAITGSAASARQMAADLTDCQEGAITYLVGNELEPTIENLYWAQHSGSQQKPVDQELLEDEGFRDQVAQVIAQAGLPVDDTTMGYGALLLANGIPLTPENIRYVDGLQNLRLPQPESQVEAAISRSVAEGKDPQEAYLMEGYSAAERAVAAMEVIAGADEETVAEVVESQEPLTIANLARAKEGSLQSDKDGNHVSEKAEGDGKDSAVTDRRLQLLLAQRQLAEVRLAMTAQANYRLIGKGVALETIELEQLVEELKSQEQNYYKQLLEQSGGVPDQEAVDSLQQTMETTESLKELPAYVLGRYELPQMTLENLYTEGVSVKDSLDQAHKAYETMMTVPRSDLGDSIQKAFGNVDEILADLELEPSPANQRAVRILAYNQTEINAENISKIKAADEKVQNLFQNLKPAVAVEMIREGIHPLNMDISTLNQKAEEILAQQDPGGEESYSRYLWDMEHSRQITPEEKESCIGIYRLLRQIEKTDGAVIGAVISQGGELSLRNLLSAMRSRKAKGFDVTVDQDFGASSEVSRSGSTIDQQINAAYQTDCAKEAAKLLTPEGVRTCMEDSQWEDMTPEQLLWQLKQQGDIRPEEEVKDGWENQELEFFSSGSMTEERALKLLSQYEMPVDAYHLVAAERLLNNRNTVFRRLFDPRNREQNIDFQKVKEDILERFGEAVKTPEDMAKAQKELADTAEHVMEGMLNEEHITSQEVRDIKIMRTQIEMTGIMAREENYAIPVLIGDEMTNVQLKIVRGHEKRGMVDILFETENSGKLSAHFQASEQRIEGLVMSDQPQLLEQLKSQEQQLASRMRLEEQQEVEFRFLLNGGMDLSEIVQAGSDRDSSGQDGAYAVQTKQLYGIARSFLETVKQEVSHES